jgi:hypothetical protein
MTPKPSKPKSLNYLQLARDFLVAERAGTSFTCKRRA